jgi:hypothetical protein
MNGRASVAALAVAIGVSLTAMTPASAAPAGNACATYAPSIPDPSGFVGVVDNPYYPLPVGRVLVYRGVKDGQTQVDRVRVTDQTKVIQGITATVVRDVAKHHGTLLEKTFDYYAQDDAGNVWYLGEDTKAWANGKVDTSGSWESGVDGAKPGLIMPAQPHVPDAYRQECLAGEALDTAAVVGIGGRVTVPDGTFHRILRSTEATELEPGAVDEKVYAPGIGIVVERAIAGGREMAELVRVSG